MEGVNPVSGCAGWSGRGQASNNSLSLADIEELQEGYVAAQANRSKDGKLPKKLYHVYD